MIVLKYERKKSIIRMQITDYIFKIVKLIFIMRIPKDYRKAMKLIHSVPRRKKQKHGRKKDLFKFFYKIDHFIKLGNLTEIKPNYLIRFRRVAILPDSEIIYKSISNIEILILKTLPGFTGFFEYLIMCDNFSYFDELQGELKEKDVSFKNRFLHDIIIYELSRIHIGIDIYSSFMNATKFMQPLFLKTVLHDPDYFPDVDIVSHALRVVPLDAIKEFFYELLNFYNTLSNNQTCFLMFLQ